MTETPSHAPPAEVSDIDLMLRAQQDGPDALEAFEALVRRHERPLFAYFARLSGDRVGAEDYTQDVFIRLWNNRHMYQPTGKFTSYLFQIARNYWINEYKRKKIRPDGAPLETSAPFASSDRRDEQPFSAAQHKELATQIESALGAIPDDQREVFILSRVNKLKYHEIAELLNIPVRTVESRLVLATRKLMSKLGAYMKTE